MIALVITTYSAVDPPPVCVCVCVLSMKLKTRMNLVFVDMKKESHKEKCVYVTETQPKSSLHRWRKISRECVCESVCACVHCVHSNVGCQQ